MFKREMVRHIGVLDENMFLLYSDSDYCYWARYRGWDVWYEPTSRVIHRLGRGSKSISEWHQKDMAAFMDKWRISPNPDGTFTAGRLFDRLDRHP
jgi:GT2 family glycosyltransferase